VPTCQPASLPASQSASQPVCQPASLPVCVPASLPVCVNYCTAANCASDPLIGKKGVGPHFEFRTGAALINQFVLPNFWFHVTTAYAILRSKGVPLGKLDFIMGAVPLDTK